MPLADLIDQLLGPSRTIRVYAPDPVPAIAEHFETTTTTVEHVPLGAAAESGFLTVHQGEEFLGSVSLATVTDLIDRSPSTPWDTERRTASYRSAFEILTELTFRSFDRRQMLTVAREVEDRAWRLGDGELHAAFQSSEALTAQLSVYERLASRDGLAVHAYVGSTAEQPATGDLEVHAVDPVELGDVWLVAFRGGVPLQGTALVGEERDVSAEWDRPGTAQGDQADRRPSPTGFVGVWTDDLDRVETVIDAVGGLVA